MLSLQRNRIARERREDQPVPKAHEGPAVARSRARLLGPPALVYRKIFQLPERIVAAKALLGE